MFSVELVLNFSRQLWLVGLLLCVEDFLSRCNNLCPKLDIFKFWRVCALGECSSKAALRAHEKNHSACRCRAILLRDSGLSQAPLEPQLTDSFSQRFPRTTHEHFQGPIPTQESHLERFTACFQLHQQRLEELVAKITFRLTFNSQFILLRSTEVPSYCKRVGSAKFASPDNFCKKLKQPTLFRASRWRDFLPLRNWSWGENVGQCPLVTRSSCRLVRASVVKHVGHVFWGGKSWWFAWYPFSGVCVVGAFYVLETFGFFDFSCVLPRGSLQDGSLNEFQCRVLQYIVPR